MPTSLTFTDPTIGTNQVLRSAAQACIPAQWLNEVNRLAFAIGGGFLITPGTLDPTTVNIVGGCSGNAIAGGDANTISGGGNLANTNRITGATAYRFIGGGYDNLIEDAITCTITAGSHNKILTTSTHGSIGGGSFNEIHTGDSGTIAGGSANVITATQATIAGGVNNQADDTATVGGGSTNTALGKWATIAGGVLNNVVSTASSSVISGGNENVITNGSFTSFGGGYQQLAGTVALSCLGSTIAGGYQNTIAQSAQSQYAAIAGGKTNTINVDYGWIPGGFGNSVTGSFGGACGAEAKAYLRAQVAQSSGKFSTVGDCQLSTLQAFKSTTDATATGLPVDGVSSSITMPNGTLWGFTVTVVAKRTDVIGEYAYYVFNGAMKRDATAASTTLLLGGAPAITYETTAAWDCAITADTANGAMKITVTGEAGKTIRWNARIDLTEVAS